MLQLMCSQTLHNPSPTGPAFLPVWWGEKVLNRKTAIEGRGEGGVGMNGRSVGMKRQERKRETAVVLSELSICLHNVWTCRCNSSRKASPLLPCWILTTYLVIPKGICWELSTCGQLTFCVLWLCFTSFVQSCWKDNRWLLLSGGFQKHSMTPSL